MTNYVGDKKLVKITAVVGVFLFCAVPVQSAFGQIPLSTPCQNFNTAFDRYYDGSQGSSWGLFRIDDLWYSGERVWFSVGEPSTDDPENMAILIRETEDDAEVIVAEEDFPGTVSYTIEAHQYIHEISVRISPQSLGPKGTLLDVGCEATGSDEPFPINIGLNDAWIDPDLDGQGVLITVYPSIKSVFLALFTYDTERPDDEVEYILKEPGHRWLTAFGPYEVNVANLDIDLTMGGVFLDSVPAPEWTPGGKMKLQLNHCNEIVLDYDIPSIGESGVLTLQRIAPDRIELCERMLVLDDE
jgi:hypothetical protein